MLGMLRDSFFNSTIILGLWERSFKLIFYDVEKDFRFYVGLELFSTVDVNEWLGCRLFVKTFPV